MFDRAIHKMSPSELLCRAIMKKVSQGCCGDKPNVFMLIPGHVFNRNIRPYISPKSFYPGPQIYIELIYENTSPSYDYIDMRYMYFIRVKNITDCSNPIRESFAYHNRTRNEHHVYTNLSISTSQVRPFIQKFLCYSQWGDVSLKTIKRDDAWSMTTESLLYPPPESALWRWAFPRI